MRYAHSGVTCAAILGIVLAAELIRRQSDAQSWGSPDFMCVAQAIWQ